MSDQWCPTCGQILDDRVESVPDSPEAPFPFTEEWYAEFKRNLEKLEEGLRADSKLQFKQVLKDAGFTEVPTDD